MGVFVALATLNATAYLVLMEHEHTVSLSLTVKDSAAALDFYTRAIGAKELYRLEIPGGGIAHAEFSIGNTRIFISDEAEEWCARAMPDGAMSSCLFSIFCEECDRAYERVVEAGAVSLAGPKDQFYGMRTALVKDPFGYRWSFSQKIEDLTPEELDRRAQKLMPPSRN